MDFSERILFIDQQISLHGSCSTAQVIARFGVDARTVGRDIEQMKSQYAAPLCYRKSLGGYTYSAPYARFSKADQSLQLMSSLLDLLAGHAADMPEIRENLQGIIRTYAQVLEPEKVEQTKEEAKIARRASLIATMATAMHSNQLVAWWPKYVRDEPFVGYIRSLPSAESKWKFRFWFKSDYDQGNPPRAQFDLTMVDCIEII